MSSASYCTITSLLRRPIAISPMVSPGQRFSHFLRETRRPTKDSHVQHTSDPSPTCQNPPIEKNCGYAFHYPYIVRSCACCCQSFYWFCLRCSQSYEDFYFEPAALKPLLSAFHGSLLPHAVPSRNRTQKKHQHYCTLSLPTKHQQHSVFSQKLVYPCR